MQVTEPTAAQLLLMVIREAARARGVELTPEAVEQYLHAFHGTDPEMVRRAFRDLFAGDNRAMPSPKAVIEIVRHQLRTDMARRALPEPTLDAVDIAFGKAIAPMVADFIAGKITGEQMDQAMVSIAKATGAYSRIAGQPGVTRDAL